MLFKNNQSRIPLTITYFSLFAFLEILVSLKNKMLVSFDISVQNMMTPLVTSTRTSIMTVVSFFGGPAISLVLAVLIAIIVYSKNRRVDGIWVVATFFSGDALAFIVKNVVRRPRPTDKVIPDSGFSFPSGHIFGMTLLILIVIYVILPYVQNPELRFVLQLLLIIWLVVLAFSRVYLRGHFATDILGSVLLAATWFKTAELLYLKYAEKLQSFLNLKLKKQS